MTDNRKIARIIDANLNRACEGSRVLEEVARFINNDSNKVQQIKSLRHDIVSAAMEFEFDYPQLLAARDIESDVGRDIKGKLEAERDNITKITMANFFRVKEALRAIEEFGRPVNPDAAEKIKKLRYRVYAIEKHFSIVKKTYESNGGCTCGVIMIIVIIAAILCFFFGNLPQAEASTRHDGLIAPRTVWETPYYIQDTGIKGPVVLLTGGIHGNEPAGYLAAEQIRHWKIKNGKLIVIPRVNVLGIRLNSRYLPLMRDRDLNRNFPQKDDMAVKGELAYHVMEFVCDLNPDWHIDLHESVNFRVQDETRCGNSIIYYPAPGMKDIVTAMLDVANLTVTDSSREFVLLKYPIDGSLARACGEILGINAMILETTREQGQPLELRVQQHCMMVQQCLKSLNMISSEKEPHP